MLVDTLEVTNKVLNALSSDPELSGYVAQFSKEGTGNSQNSFPFLIVEYPSFCEKQLLAASGIFVYRFEILAGIKNLAPGVTYKGNESGRKGIVEMCNDIVHVVKDNPLSGTFIIPAYNIRIEPKYIFDDSETIIIGRVSFDADVWFKHK